MSTSMTWVSCAETSSDSLMRLAMVCRMREAFSVVPRSFAASSGISSVNGFFDSPAGADAEDAAGRFAAAARTSCLRMRPPTPVPVTVERSTPSSRARRRTSGVT